MVNFFYSAEFLKVVKRLAKKYKSFVDDLEELQKVLSENPYEGVDLGNGVRKIRMSIKSKGKGKRGGARIITFNVFVSSDDINITFVTAYDKSEQESISDKKINQLLENLKNE